MTDIYTMNTEVASLNASILLGPVVTKRSVFEEGAKGCGRYDMLLEMCAENAI
jgi:hypothetical protein